MNDELKDQLGQELYAVLRGIPSPNWTELTEGERERLSRAGVALYKCGYFAAMRVLHEHGNTIR